MNTDLQAHNPDYMRNRDLRFFAPKGVSLKIRAGVGAFYWSGKLHLRKALFGLISLL